MDIHLDLIEYISNLYNNNHDISEIYCINCGLINYNISKKYDICSDCNNYLYFVCYSCTDIIKVRNFTDLCSKKITPSLIKIQRFYKKRYIRKKLIKYKYYILDKYFNPNSEYIKYISNNLYTVNNKKQLAFINNNNKLIILVII